MELGGSARQAVDSFSVEGSGIRNTCASADGNT